MPALPLVLALCLAGLAFLTGLLFRHCRESASWFALAALGQGMSLSLVVAGPSLRYQHYLPVEEMVRDHAGVVVALLFQGVIVFAAIIRRLRAHPQLRTWLGSWRLWAAAALTLSTAATVSPDGRRYAVELGSAALIQLVAMANLVLVAASWPSDRGLDTLRRHRTEDRQGWSNVMYWLPVAVAVLGSVVLSIWAFQRHPHVPDEISYLQQARYFAQGRATLPAPPVPSGFDMDLMELEDGRWYSPFPPGWPAALALGVMTGLPWLVNPLIAGLNVLLTRVFLAQFLRARTARAAAWLLATSPWFVFLGMSFMSHQFALMCALLTAIGLCGAAGPRGAVWALVAGSGAGATSLVRPLDGVIVGGLLLVAFTWLWKSDWNWRRPAALIIGLLITGGLGLGYNWRITGNPLVFPVNAYFDKHYGEGHNDYGFGPDRGLGWGIDPNPGHSVFDGLVNTNLNFFGLNTDLFGWAAGSLLFVWVLLASGRWRKGDVLLVAIVAAVILAHFPYYFSGGPDFGARYWFLAVVPLAALTARGIEVLEDVSRQRVWPAVVAMTIIAWFIFVPWRAADKYRGYRGMSPQVRQLAREYGIGPDLVLVKGSRFPDYASAFAENPLDLTSRATIFAWDRNQETRVALLRAYSDRLVWLVEGPSVTGSRYRVTEGPLSAKVLLAGGQ